MLAWLFQLSGLWTTSFISAEILQGPSSIKRPKAELAPGPPLILDGMRAR